MHVLEVRGGANLCEKPLRTDDRRQFGLEDLDRNVAAVPEVLGEVDRGHPTLAERPLDAAPVTIASRM